jgi:hypothetical protein
MRSINSGWQMNMVLESTVTVDLSSTKFDTIGVTANFLRNGSNAVFYSRENEMCCHGKKCLMCDYWRVLRVT